MANKDANSRGTGAIVRCRLSVGNEVVHKMNCSKKSNDL